MTALDKLEQTHIVTPRALVRAKIRNWDSGLQTLDFGLRLVNDMLISFVHIIVYGFI